MNKKNISLSRIREVVRATKKANQIIDSIVGSCVLEGSCPSREARINAKASIIKAILELQEKK